MTARINEVVITDDEDASRLDRWLAKRFNYHSRTHWQALIQRGEIIHNGHKARAASTRIRSGDTLAYAPAETAEPHVNTSYSIQFEDSGMLIVSKSGNLPCHPAGCFFRNTLWYILRKKVPEIRIINRLDRETSGLVVMAKNRDSSKHLCRQFANRTVTKRYLVLVHGEFPEHMQIRGKLIRDKSSTIRKKRRLATDSRQTGEFAWTTFDRLQARNGVSLLLAQPQTGRTHQIRASLCSSGFPVVGDKIYGEDESLFLKFINGDPSPHNRPQRQLLHAYELNLTHPESSRPVNITAPLPIDFHTTLSEYGIRDVTEPESEGVNLSS